MTGFDGFQPNSQKTAIPNVFFTRLMPLIKDATELKIVLHVFWALQQKKGSPRFATFRGLLGDKTLAPSLGEDITERVEALEGGLRGAVEKGIFITTEVEAKGLRHQLYMLNTESDRRALGGIKRGQLAREDVPVVITDSESQVRPNAFEVYEENIGPLTPIIAEELKQALDLYPEDWIVGAIHDAAKSSVRNWVYIEKILKSRKAEGGSAASSELYELSSLYRRNIGRVTPIILDELRQAAALYPEEWIVDAIHEAVRNSAQSWVYIEAILKNWRAEGRGNGETGQNTGPAEDTEKYFKGRYGHLVKDRFD